MGRQRRGRQLVRVSAAAIRASDVHQGMPVKQLRVYIRWLP